MSDTVKLHQTRASALAGIPYMEKYSALCPPPVTLASLSVLINGDWSSTQHICLTQEGRWSFRHLTNLIVFRNSVPSQSPIILLVPVKGYQDCLVAKLLSNWRYLLWSLAGEVKYALHKEQPSVPGVERGPHFTVVEHLTRPTQLLY